MGLQLGGGGGSKQRDPLNKRLASNVLFEGLFPGLVTGNQRGGKREGAAGILNTFQNQSGQTFGSSLAGLPGLSTTVRAPGNKKRRQCLYV
jgi:hypothetical protein